MNMRGEEYESTQSNAMKRNATPQPTTHDSGKRQPHLKGIPDGCKRYRELQLVSLNMTVQNINLDFFSDFRFWATETQEREEKSN